MISWQHSQNSRSPQLIATKLWRGGRSSARLSATLSGSRHVDPIPASESLGALVGVGIALPADGSGMLIIVTRKETGQRWNATLNSSVHERTSETSSN